MHSYIHIYIMHACMHAYISIYMLIVLWDKIKNHSQDTCTVHICWKEPAYIWKQFYMKSTKFPNMKSLALPYMPKPSLITFKMIRCCTCHVHRRFFLCMFRGGGCGGWIFTTRLINLDQSKLYSFLKCPLFAIFLYFFLFFWESIPHLNPT